jgi:Glycosyltransferase family 87
MKRNLLISLLLVLSAVAMLVLALYVPNSLPVHSDFSAIYNTNLALVNRVPIYDIPKVEMLAAQHSGLDAEKFFLARFPYPPWYALSTFYLGLLPAKAAATLWFEINLVMLFLSVWLLTDGWPGRLRLIAFPLALFFFPVLGALSVGQYDFPVLLGVSLLTYSLQKENVALATLGIVLLTFKPHVGALILVAAFGWLVYNGGSFGRRVMRSSVLAGLLLFVTGFLADPRWITSYPGMLASYQNEGNVSACSECASLPIWLSRWLSDGSLSMATLIAMVLLIVLLTLFLVIRQVLLNSPVLLITAALLVTLLVSPYLYNYDFLLLLVAFAILINRGSLMQSLLMVICYLIPTLALLLFGRAGNTALTLVTIALTALLYFEAKNPSLTLSGQRHTIQTIK